MSTHERRAGPALLFQRLAPDECRRALRQWGASRAAVGPKGGPDPVVGGCCAPARIAGFLGAHRVPPPGIERQVQVPLSCRWQIERGSSISPAAPSLRMEVGSSCSLRAGIRCKGAGMRYIALLHQEPEVGEIEVSFPDLPGCVTAGPTLAEARRLAGEALRGHLAAWGAAGLPMPEPSALAAVVEHPNYADSVALMLVEVPAQPT
jgi:predicted RNase H-like HicB family nuclease